MYILRGFSLSFIGFFKDTILVDNRAYHIIHTHFILPDGLMSCLIKLESGLPYIITAHGSDVPGYNPANSDLHIEYWPLSGDLLQPKLTT